MLQHDFYPCCGIDHPPNEGGGEKCKTSGLFVAMQNTAAGRKQPRPAVSRGSRHQQTRDFILYSPKSEWQAAKSYINPERPFRLSIHVLFMIMIS